MRAGVPAVGKVRSEPSLSDHVLVAGAGCPRSTMNNEEEFYDAVTGEQRPGGDTRRLELS